MKQSARNNHLSFPFFKILTDLIPGISSAINSGFIARVKASEELQLINLDTLTVSMKNLQRLTENVLTSLPPFEILT